MKMKWQAGAAVLMVTIMAIGWASASSNEIRDPITRQRVPDDGRIELRDYGYRDWGPELVHYTLDAARFKPNAVSLVEAEGRLIPFQIDGNTLTFVASVPNGGEAVYLLTEGGPKAETALHATENANVLDIRNKHLAIRLPKPNSKTYQPAAAAATVPPPILQWACIGHDWMGGARFVTARKVKSYSSRIVRNGPACVEYEARYSFAPRGEYVLRIRLSPEIPVAIVTEEFDMGEVTIGEDLLMLDLHKGWQPETISLVPGAGETQMPGLSSSGYQAFVAKKRQTAAQAAPVGGTGQAPSPFCPEPGLVLLAKNVPAGKWGGYMGGVQVSGTGKPGNKIGLVTLHTGAWRRATALNAWHKEGTGVTIGLPLSVRYIRWSLDIADDFSPFSTHEHDRDLSRTYGRRVWGLYVGNELNAAQARFGYVGLDRYKDWVIDWPEERTEDGGVRYPGCFYSAAQMDRLKKCIGQHPDAAALRKWYLISGNPADAARHAQAILNRLTKPYGESGFFVVGLTHYRQAQFRAFVLEAEDALACPELPTKLRERLRRRLALYANLMSEPDFNPREAGVHLGNNNMTINRTLALTYFAGLLPDHPRYAYWMDRLRRYAAFKFASQTAPCGAWIGCPTYQLYSPTRALNVTQNVLRNRGVHDFAPQGYHAATLGYLANLTMPDPRYRGWRIIPGMGNSSNRVESIWGISMAAVADHDPEQAGFFRYLFRLSKGGTGITEQRRPGRVGDDAEVYAPFYLPDVPEHPMPLKTAFLPAYGVMFRAHFGRPDETAMLFRAGMNWSHWDTDCLNVVLYGKGAPLSPGTGYQYYPGTAQHNNGIYHNRVKVGRRDLQEVFGRVDDAVADYGFGDRADYAVADRFYPSQLFRDGKGAMHWRRHVLFLKSRTPAGPSYFVMRDTFPGGEEREKWWYWLNLETEERISVDGQAFEKGKAPAEKVVPVDQMPALRGRTIEMKTDFGASSWFWFSEPHDVRVRMLMQYPRQDGLGGKGTKTIVEIPAGPKQDYFYVVYPRKGSEAVPQCKLLAAGVLQVTTAEATDTVFVGDRPFDWSRDGLTFSGKAGAIRVFGDRVALAMNAGSGSIGYRGHVLKGHGPFERTIKLSELKPNLHEVTGGYEKKVQTLDLGRGVKVTGEAPFTAALEGDTIRIQTDGRARVLHVTQPRFIVRPQYYVDGQEWMACWTDYPASGWGSYDETWQIGLSVPAGKHELLVKDMVFPISWERQFEPLIEGVVRD